jgi:hypothetical protein
MISLDKICLGENSYEYTPSQPHPQWGRKYRVEYARPKYAKDSALREWTVTNPEGRIIARPRDLAEAELAIKRSVIEYATVRSRNG